MEDMVFSPKQRRVLTWWRPGSPDRDKQAIICDCVANYTIVPPATDLAVADDALPVLNSLTV